MLFYVRLCVACLLLNTQFSQAQTDTFIQNVDSTQTNDSITLNYKYPKYEVALLPITLYYVPAYFSSSNKIIPVVGLQAKYFVKKNTVLRLSFNYSNVKIGTLSVNLSDNKQYTRQYSVGAQHNFLKYKNLRLYFFADVYYQTFTSDNYVHYSHSQNIGVSTYISYDSLVHYIQKVNSYNLLSGVGFKFMDRKHVFASFESGIGISYYTKGSQQATGTSTIDSYTTGPAPNYYQTSVHNVHPLPKVDTKISGVSLYANIIRLAIGFVF